MNGDYLSQVYSDNANEVFDYLEDDDVQTQVERLLFRDPLLATCILGACALVSFFGILGAIHYSGRVVMAVALWYFAVGILVTVSVGLGGIMILISAFNAYPHFVFYQEQAEGIMTADNYENEVYSCCCAPNQRKISIREAIENRLGVFA